MPKTSAKFPFSAPQEGASLCHWFPWKRSPEPPPPLRALAHPSPFVCVCVCVFAPANQLQLSGSGRKKSGAVDPPREEEFGLPGPHTRQGLSGPWS